MAGTTPPFFVSCGRCRPVQFGNGLIEPAQAAPEEAADELDTADQVLLL